MTRFLALLVMCALLATFLCPTEAHAQDTPAGAEASAADRMHDELRELAATMETAMNAGDIDTITSRVTEDMVFTTMNGDVVRGRDGIRQYFEKMMQGPNRVVESLTTNFEPDDLSILLDDRTAVAFGASSDRYQLADGPTIDISARWSATLVRREDRWDLANFHYSANVFDNPILAAQRKFLLLLLGGGGLAVAVIAFLIGRRSGDARSA